jgi:hypothetical protein
MVLPVVLQKLLKEASALSTLEGYSTDPLHSGIIPVGEFHVSW